MQHDDVIWQAIRHNHCSYMAKITTGNFCRNVYNVTGVCNRSSCPLANSRYATVRDHEGVFYLYMKTIERAHRPIDLWERIKLPRNYEKALEIIDKNLQYWPKFLVHKTKQRLTKLTQVRIRSRKLQLKPREKIMTMPRKETKRESRREEKAEKAAALEKSIEKELLQRLNKGVYNDIYNYNFDAYQKILDMEELEATAEEEEEPEVEYVEGSYEEEEDIEDFGDFVKDMSLIDDEAGENDSDEDEDHDQQPRKKKRGSGSEKSKGKRGVHIEVEQEEGIGERRASQTQRLLS